MPVDFENFLNTLRAGIGLVPPALIAIILLGGPTASWLLYRFVVQPRNSRMRSIDGTAMWVCPNCRSVNELPMPRCYRCDASPDEDDLEVIDAHPAGPIRLSPVGPGLDLGGRGVTRLRPISQIERAEDIWVEDAWRQQELQRESQALADATALPEVAEATPGRRGVRPPNARPPSQVPVGPGRPIGAPTVARPRRAVVAGSGPVEDPDDTPAA